MALFRANSLSPYHLGLQTHQATRESVSNSERRPSLPARHRAMHAFRFMVYTPLAGIVQIHAMDASSFLRARGSAPRISVGGTLLPLSAPYHAKCTMQAPSEPHSDRQQRKSFQSQVSFAASAFNACTFNSGLHHARGTKVTRVDVFLLLTNMMKRKERKWKRLWWWWLLPLPLLLQLPELQTLIFLIYSLSNSLM